MFSADFVLDVLDHVPDAIVDGGWGIDALIGRVTRAHDDLDLVVPLARADAIVDALRPLGFTERIDEPPARIVLRTPYDQRVDLHVVTPSERGMVQEVGDGRRFTYALHGEGTILGRTVRCLSSGMQVVTHSQYEPDEQDRSDIALLAAATGESVAPPYARITGDEPIRAATASDCAAFCSVRHRSWQHAYTGVMPQGVLDAMDLGAAYSSWWPFLRLPPTRRRGALVAGRPGTVVGLTVLGPTRDADLDPAVTGEINLLYVDPLAIGLGIGHRLLTAATTWLHEHKFEDLRLWTFQGNSKARSFYERHGWWHDGGARTETEPQGSWESVRYQLLG
ncbi:MAG: lincosamide nucleotidyltransferase [Acidimicrobiaceae bacterium]|jgi:lincosamide nucleotidyltransferase A/C/D/E